MPKVAMLLLQCYCAYLSELASIVESAQGIQLLEGPHQGLGGGLVHEVYICMSIRVGVYECIYVDS